MPTSAFDDFVSFVSEKEWYSKAEAEVGASEVQPEAEAKEEAEDGNSKAWAKSLKTWTQNQKAAASSTDAAQASGIHAKPRTFSVAKPSTKRAHASMHRVISDEERDHLRRESELSAACGMTWEKRGPPGGPHTKGCDADNNAHWRGQSWRTGENRKGDKQGEPRWGNRGGQHRDYHSAIHKFMRSHGCSKREAKDHIDSNRGGDPRKRKMGGDPRERNSQMPNMRGE